jgi:hypothetical protein
MGRSDHALAKWTGVFSVVSRVRPIELLHRALHDVSECIVSHELNREAHALASKDLRDPTPLSLPLLHLLEGSILCTSGHSAILEARCGPDVVYPTAVRERYYRQH